MTKKMIRLDIVCCDKGEPVPDWQVESMVRHELNLLQVCVVNDCTYDVTHYYCNWLVIDMYRALIHKEFPELKNYVRCWLERKLFFPECY